jgi:hypothetical protein
MYAAALACIVAGIIFWWPLALLAPAGFALRVAKKIYINRREPYFRPWQIGPYFAVTGFLIFFIDLAMFAGWGRYLSLEMGGAGK